MVVDQNFLKVKKYFLLIIFFLLFTSKSYSDNYTFIKIIELDEPWGSSFINNDEIIITEKSGKIKIINLASKEVTEIKHNLNFLEVGQGGLLDIIYQDNTLWISYSENRGDSKTSTSIAKAEFNTKELDFNDDSLTANMRCAYPLAYISNASETAIGGQPNNIIMLTCDAFGVLPPIARLSPEHAMYHFLSGFTSKVAGTERGVTEPQPTFSTCFGAPFMPRRPEVYGALLRDKIAKNQSKCWLVNTGWTGGAYGTGSRMPIKATRALLTAALNGSLNNSLYRKDDNFGFEVPTYLDGVDTSLLNPRDTWEDKSAYDTAASTLVSMFLNNFAQYENFVGRSVLAQAIKNN